MVVIKEVMMVDRSMSEIVRYTLNIGLQSFIATLETRVQEDDTTQVRKQC